jgi:peptidoglycan-N-acetylglucosamine deacetylase
MSTIPNNITDENYLPKIAKWFNNKQCALSLRFDDNLDSHITKALPLLDKFDIKATFMVNPGRNNFILNYNKNKIIWEKKIPSMGHRLGNHTWNHKGAKNLKEADHEIGEAARLIWKLYPEKSKLNVYASGGGETWGGRRWHKASYEYKAIAEKYFLIDLYDGTHTRIELNSDYNDNQIKLYIETAITDRQHQAFVFHKIGNGNFIDYVKHVLTGHNNCFSEKQFIGLLEEVASKRDYIWLAPLIDILKYKLEYASSTLELKSIKDNRLFIFSYNQSLDSTLYDQPLTIILPPATAKQSTKVYQNDRELEIEKDKDKIFFVNIDPRSSELIICNSDNE